MKEGGLGRREDREGGGRIGMKEGGYGRRREDWEGGH